MFKKYSLPPGLTGDLFWNYTSFGVMGGLGLLLNFFLAWKYSPEMLGYFWQLYVIFLLAGHLAAGGLYFSILRLVAVCEHGDNVKILTASLVVALVSSFVVGAAIYLSKPFFLKFFDNELLDAALNIISFSVIFSSFNKVFYSYLNGIGKIKYYSWLHIVRNVIFLIAFLLVVYFFDASYFPYIFLFSELILTILVFCLNRKIFGMHSFSYCHSWFKKLCVLSFKSGSVPFLLDLNIKVDLLVVSALSSGVNVGVYAFVAMIYEGMYQFAFALQANVNPRLAKLYTLGKKEEIVGIFKISFLSMSSIYMCAFVFVAAFYTDLLGFLGVREEYFLGREVLLILIGGLIFSGGAIPVMMVFNQAGFPGVQARYLLVVVLFNLFVSILFVSYFDIIGAAIAMSVTITFMAVLLFFMSSRVLEIDLFRCK
jgi:O-antigen/teichoic acid export membrane protein